jgi:hypothetical protein
MKLDQATILICKGGGGRRRRRRRRRRRIPFVVSTSFMSKLRN